MSCVTDTILLFDMGQKAEDRLAEVNAFLKEHTVRGEFALLNTKKDAEGHFCCGGGAHLQAYVAVGAFNYLPIEKFEQFLRAEVSWSRRTAFVQLVLQHEHDHGFSFIEILKTV